MLDRMTDETPDDKPGGSERAKRVNPEVLETIVRTFQETMAKMDAETARRSPSAGRVLPAHPGGGRAPS